MEKHVLASLMMMMMMMLRLTFRIRQSAIIFITSHPKDQNKRALADSINQKSVVFHSLKRAVSTVMNGTR